MEGWRDEVGRRLRRRLTWIVQWFTLRDRTGPDWTGRDRAGQDCIWGVWCVRGSWRMGCWLGGGFWFGAGR